MPDYSLPDLPYDYGDLEPHISGAIMELHHDKHHRGYVTRANQILSRLREARSANDFTGLVGMEKELAFHISGHVLHSIFWRNMMPKGGGRPTGELAAAITRDFESFENFQRQLTQAAGSIMGSGWAALVWEPVGRRLLVTQIHDHQSNSTQGGVPLMVIDAWEHAYYLQYRNQKMAFFEAVWNLWNWQDVAGRLAGARQLDVGLPGASG